MDKTKYLEILDLKKNAKWEDVEKAYNTLKNLYVTNNNNYLFWAIEEFSEEDKEKQLENIEFAYQELRKYYKVKKLQDGTFIKQYREQNNISLIEIAQALNIDEDIISAIEENNYSIFKDSGYLRWILKKYIRELSLHDNVVDDYMQCYRKATVEQKK